MRGTIAAVLVAMSTTVTVLPVLAVSAQAAQPGAPAAQAGTTGTLPAADEPPREVLERAASALDQEPAAGAPPAARPDATLALRDLYRALPRLIGEERLQAERLLARPSDGAEDNYGDGYSVPSTKKCQKNVCLHWVRSTADAPPSNRWALRTLDMMTKVWAFEVGKLGYRRPAPDPGGPRSGGDKRFDVYLKELGSKGIYGYCAPEYLVGGSKRLASGFCVLDDDFARSQFGAPPVESLKVTAAHEFFHAVQFNYDFREDPWLLESTATWMEERFADSVNDNRQYLPFGQVRLPGIPLDTFSSGGVTHYGNWAFWEYLTQRYGNEVVQNTWNKAGAFKGAGNQYSTAALKSVLKSRGGFGKVFRSYAAGNAIASRTYAEGRAFPTARTKRVFVLGKASRRGASTTRIDHLAANHLVFRPARSLTGRSWKLRVVVDAPNRGAGGSAYLIVKKRQGAWVRKGIPLSRQGNGAVTFTFTRSTVQSAVVTLVNANTSFRCGQDTSYSCQGVPRSDNRKYALLGQVLKR